MAEYNTPEFWGMNFVQRYLSPSKYPQIDNEDGTFSTHLMSTAEADGRYLAYPSIIMDAQGKLKS